MSGGRPSVIRQLARLRGVHRFSRAPGYPPTWRTTTWWGLWFVMSLGAVAFLAYLVGYVPPGKASRRVVDSLYRAVTQPGVSLPLAFAILTFSTYCFRRVRLEWLAYKPGRIQVPDFSAANLTAISAAQLTTAFRHRLARMRLASSGAAPAAQQESDFLSVLGADQVSSSNILGTLVQLLKAGSPAYAWQISGDVVQLEGTVPSYRVLLQVLRLPSEGTPPVEVTDTDLDRAIRAAADGATAAILPRTRLCKGPWVAWRRFVMPGALFSAYEDACEHTNERRYDQALELYYSALEQDPLNSMVRLQLGQLQEKLHLSLEALATYTGMIDAARPAGTDLPAGLYTFSAERARWRALLIARYRRIVLLAGESFVEQWFETAGERHSDRDRRQASLRMQLTPCLTKRLGANGFHCLMQAGSDGAIWTGPREDPKRLRMELTDFAVAEVYKLRSDLPLAWPLRPRPPLTRRTLDLTRICIEQGVMVGQERAIPDALAEDLGKRVRHVERFRRLRRWQEEYNAACVFAIPLLGELTDRVRQRLAEEAVRRLELASGCADSSFIASRRDWITSEDPDLGGLRLQPRFKAFEAQYFPSGAPIPRRPKGAQELAELHCTRDMLASAARSWETVWRARATMSHKGEQPAASRWWRDEQEVWRHIHDVALHHDWQVRLAMMKAAREWHLSYRLEPVEAAFKRYGENALLAAEGAVDAAADKEIEQIHQHLLDVVELIRTYRCQGLTTSFSALDIFDAEPTMFTPALRCRLCRRQAATWRRLHEFLMPTQGPQGSDTDELRRSFERELRHAERGWKRTSRSVPAHRALRR